MVSKVDEYARGVKRRKGAVRQGIRNESIIRAEDSRASPVEGKALLKENTCGAFRI